MAYNTFTISELQKKFNTKIKITFDSIFSTPIVPKKPSPLLKETLNYNLPLALAISTEKARSELIVTPVLVEIRRICKEGISIFSGIDFTIDSAQGLNGRCDFLISLSEQQLELTAPVIALVEAKNNNLNSGIAQCIAEMIAAQLFNKKHNQQISTIYGIVTTGSLWKFLRLEENTVFLEATETHIENIPRILGTLLVMVRGNKSA